MEEDAAYIRKMQDERLKDILARLDSHMAHCNLRWIALVTLMLTAIGILVAK